MNSNEIKDNELKMRVQYQNLSMSENITSDFEMTSNESPGQHIDEKALRMMQKMGYKKGAGLGKSEQGITEIVDVSYQFGKRGFGLKLKNIVDITERWDFSLDVVNLKEDLIWLRCEKSIDFCLDEMCSWILEGPAITDIYSQDTFCDKKILFEVLKAKDIFDEMGIIELCQARARCNPFETIRSVFFLNRASLKMANIDAITDFMFTGINKNEYFQNEEGPFYFADVCAGPGGFTEYILWRKKWLFKGFGLTLRDENDFKLEDSICTCPATFQALYGKNEDGNVCDPENILDFKDKVLHETDGKGVHFMMSDGGFSVEGNENFQEILSKNIYICQCLVALEIVRHHGNFVTKLFDVFTSFSVGLLYLMFQCFEKVSILKPNSSRPANSERYFICSNLKKDSKYFTIKKYLWKIVYQLWELKDTNSTDILELVPLELLKKDEYFFKYICESNNKLALRQTINLKKLATFCRNPTLVEFRQDELRKKCLEFWQIPDKPKTPAPQLGAAEILKTVLNKPEMVLVQPREIYNLKLFNELILDIEDWYYYPLFSSRKIKNCNYYAGVSFSKVCRLQKQKWIKTKNIQLPKGTLLYGEFVKEKCLMKSDQLGETEIVRYSLHVIDALRLGERDLTKLKFRERRNLLKIYCKSVNKESQQNLVRIRLKPADKLINISSNCLISEGNGRLYSQLLPLGYNTVSEICDVNSILLLKTNSNQTFQWSYVLRVQIFMENEESIEDTLKLGDLISEVKNRS